MNPRERYQSILSRKKWLSLHTQLMLMVSGELVLCILVGLGVYYLLVDAIPMDSRLLLLLDLLAICLAISNVINRFLGKYFIAPIDKLSYAIGKVADGDFSVRLEEHSASNELMQVYSGFNMMVNELQTTEILQTDFVSNVSHEFKTPINAIEGYSMLLQGAENLTEDQQRYLEKIIFNTNRLSDLVGSMLLLSKIENQGIPTGRTTYRLDEQIRGSIVALEPHWEAKNVEFDVDLDRIDYTGNEAMMYHVWDNLIGNAIKFGPENGVIRIRLQRRGNVAVFTVEDEGTGLSEQTQKHMFDKFYQADKSHWQEGSGLGLPLVKKILDINGDEIFAENRQSGGACFTVRLHM